MLSNSLVTCMTLSDVRNILHHYRTSSRLQNTAGTVSPIGNFAQSSSGYFLRNKNLQEKIALEPVEVCFAVSHQGLARRILAPMYEKPEYARLIVKEGVHTRSQNAAFHRILLRMSGSGALVPASGKSVTRGEFRGDRLDSPRESLVRSQDLSTENLDFGSVHKTHRHSYLAIAILRG